MEPLSSSVAVSSTGVRAGSLAAWMAVTRPRSLLVALSPVLVGAAVGYERTGFVDPVAAFLVLAGALLVQLISNMQNDVGYTARGGERSGTRTGLPRATAKGWLEVRQVRIAAGRSCWSAARRCSPRSRTWVDRCRSRTRRSAN
jgi:hypothetical protein